jgi:hypothetical protein
MEEDKLVTVCDHCQKASCWQGDFMCEDARNAGNYNMPVSELKKLKLESPDYWK